jgi:hypothetical protein
MSIEKLILSIVKYNVVKSVMSNSRKLMRRKYG